MNPWERVSKDNSTRVQNQFNYRADEATRLMGPIADQSEAIKQGTTGNFQPLIFYFITPRFNPIV